MIELKAGDNFILAIDGARCKDVTIRLKLRARGEQRRRLCSTVSSVRGIAGALVDLRRNERS
jgi:hypothetical protein